MPEQEKRGADLQGLRGIWGILTSMSLAGFVLNAQPALPAAATESGMLLVMLIFAWSLVEIVSDPAIVAATERLAERVQEVTNSA